VHDARPGAEHERPWYVGLERLSSPSGLVARIARGSLVGITPGGVRARGLGMSQGRERAVVDTTKGCPSRGCVPLNQGVTRGSGFEGECFALLQVREAADGAVTDSALTGAFVATRHSEVETVFDGSSSRAPLSRGGPGAKGRHPRCEAPYVAEQAPAMRGSGVRAGDSQGVREPGGVRHAECIGSIATEAGDG